LYYSGEHDLEFVMHLNSELGLEKDYVAYMNQGLSVDYAVASPSHMSTFSKMATLLDPPMLYRDAGHWSKVLSGDVLQPVVDDIYKRADILLLGYGGGGVRHLIVNKPVTNMSEIKNVPIRVMGAPIQTKLFDAFGMAPSVIAYSEVYNAIQTGVIDAAENEAAGIRQMKFYEVGPNISLTAHSITVRPLAISGKTLRNLPEDLQVAIIQAGKDAGTFGRVIELTEGQGIMSELEDAGKLNTVAFTERDQLMSAAIPVLKEYFKDVGAAELYDAIQAVQ
jgi:TRAP-type C4-dicarboxylate transport system substrate-binding protein